MSLKLVVIGSKGFIGSRLSLKLLSLTRFHISPTETLPLDKIVLFDVNEQKDPHFQQAIASDPRCEVISGDLCNKATILRILDPEDKYTRVTVIHLAAVLSGYCEQDFDLGMKVNLYGTLNVIECLRHITKTHAILGNKPQVYFYSSTDYVMCFNEINQAKHCDEETFRLSPVSYGCQKACMEILVSDYTRRGFIDGRVGRFCAVIGRPGNVDVLSYAWHGVFTQTLVGKDYKCGLPLNIGIPCCSVANIVKNVIYVCGKVDGTQIGDNRVITMPNKTMRLDEIWEATQDVAEKYGLKDKMGKLVEVKTHASTVNKVNVCSMADHSKAKRLGLDVKVDIHDIITDFVENWVRIRYPHLFPMRSKM